MAGERTDDSGALVRNTILSSIPEQEYELLRRHLELVDLPQQLILHEPGDEIEFAYFLNSGLASLVVLTRDGRSVEVAAPELRLLLNRYVLIQGSQIAQIAACNRLHEIEQRLARWLLMCQDRVDSDLLPVTHEFLSQMLGTGRPSVSLAAGTLQRAGSIENLRGTVRITNRKHLEDAACECYRAMQHFNGSLRVR